MSFSPEPTIACNALPGQPAKLSGWGCLVQQAVAHERPYIGGCPCQAGLKVRRDNPAQWQTAKGKSIHFRRGGWAGVVDQVNPNNISAESREKLKNLKDQSQGELHR
ncbi:MAG: hypothetical protein WC600_17105 [Desulfobaccales bacterium]